MRKLAAGLILLGLAVHPVLPRTPSATPARKVRIVASIFPLMEFAKAVAGETAEVSLLLPPGAGVHTWQPRASDIIRTTGADLFIHVGGGLEPWVEDFLGSVADKRLRVLAAVDFLELERETHAGKEAVDPHVWLDFGNDRTIVARLAAALGEIDPDGAAAYSERASAYGRKIEEMDRLYADGLKTCANRVLLVAGHEAFGYLAHRYRLEQISLSGLSPDADPTPKAVAAMVEKARSLRIRSIFREAGESPKLAGVLAREVPAAVLILHTGDNISRQERDSGVTFLDLMRMNLVSLKQGLGCE